jgi:uncharacterized protein YdhG (YjbR/CyaY superfamily)
MKRRKPSIRKSASKNKAAPKTAAEYLARVPLPARSALTKMRAAIRSAVPRDAVEIISYGIPAFKNKKILVWFAAFTDHCSLFPTAATIKKFSNELKPFSTSKGTIHFPLKKHSSRESLRARVKSSSLLQK